MSAGRFRTGCAASVPACPSAWTPPGPNPTSASCRGPQSSFHYNLHASKVLLTMHSYLTHKTGRMRPLWIVWQCNAETTGGELVRDSGLQDLAMRGECSRADIYVYLCQFVFTLILYTYETTYICRRNTSIHHATCVCLEVLIRERGSSSKIRVSLSLKLEQKPI